MESRAKLFGHPIHPMLIVFPLGLLTTSLIFDVIYVVTGSIGFTEAAFYMIAAGVVGGFAAALFGLIDWMEIPNGTRAKKIGLWHGIGNTVVMALFIVSWLMRDTTPDAFSLIFAGAGVALAFFTAWLGGELVDRLSVGIDPGAHLNSPNSLTGRPAHEHATGYQE